MSRAVQSWAGHLHNPQELPGIDPYWEQLQIYLFFIPTRVVKQSAEGLTSVRSYVRWGREDVTEQCENIYSDMRLANAVYQGKKQEREN